MLKLENVSVARNKTKTLFDISLSLAPTQTLAVVGESGAGKSTLIAAILGLVPLTSGDVTWNGEAVRNIHPALVMQEPRAAFNPAMKLRQSVLEPLVARKLTLQPGRLEMLCKGLELPLELLDRRPAEVSIGQAQRVGILRALITKPKLVLFDEPLSALDAVTQKHTARLIAELQKEEGFAALIVTHDLGYAAAYGDDILVLKSGKVEEVATAQKFLEKPATKYGRKLRDAAVALGALEQAA